jgi:hypothetical protein
LSQKFYWVGKWIYYLPHAAHRGGCVDFYFEDKPVSVTFRIATPNDAATIRQLMIEVAGNQNLESVPTEENLRHRIQELKPPFECLLAELNEKPVGFALFPDLLYSIAAIRRDKQAHVFSWKTGL